MRQHGEDDPPESGAQPMAPWELMNLPRSVASALPDPSDCVFCHQPGAAGSYYSSVNFIKLNKQRVQHPASPPFMSPSPPPRSPRGGLRPTSSPQVRLQARSPRAPARSLDRELNASRESSSMSRVNWDDDVPQTVRNFHLIEERATLEVRAPPRMVRYDSRVSASARFSHNFGGAAPPDAVAGDSGGVPIAVPGAGARLGPPRSD